MSQARWTIEANNIARINAPRLSQEERGRVSVKVAAQFGALPIVWTPCNQCFQTEVSEAGKTCFKCAVILEKRAARQLKKERLELCQRILIYGLVAGALVIWLWSVWAK